MHGARTCQSWANNNNAYLTPLHPLPPKVADSVRPCHTDTCVTKKACEKDRTVHRALEKQATTTPPPPHTHPATLRQSHRAKHHYTLGKVLEYKRFTTRS